MIRILEYMKKQIYKRLHHYLLTYKAEFEINANPGLPYPP